MKVPTISGYWEGYPENEVKPFQLDQVSDTPALVTVAFIAPQPAQEGHKTVDWEWGIAALSYTPDQIQMWINAIHQMHSHQRVLFSLLDTPQCHWNQVDPVQFANNLARDLIRMRVDGVDIDAESDMPTDVYAESFIHLIKELRRALGPQKIITYTCYTESDLDTQILSATKNDIDIVQTMAYWDNLDGMKQLFDHYASIVGKDKISVGVKAGAGDGSSTDLETVQQVADWLSQAGYHKMMLWSLTRDVEAITGKPDGTWLATINQNLIHGTVKEKLSDPLLYQAREMVERSTADSEGDLSKNSFIPTRCTLF